MGWGGDGNSLKSTPGWRSSPPAGLRGRHGRREAQSRVGVTAGVAGCSARTPQVCACCVDASEHGRSIVLGEALACARFRYGRGYRRQWRVFTVLVH